MNMIRRTQFNLKNCNTFRITSIAKEVYMPSSLEECERVLSEVEAPVIIGAGSNIIFSSDGIDEPLVLTRNLNKINLTDEFLEVECGVKSPVLAYFAMQNSITGFEYLYTIPSFIGGNIVMNASACNQSISDVIISCKVFDIEKKTTVELDKTEMKFGYRSSVFRKNPKKFAVLSAKFDMNKGIKVEIKSRMENGLSLRAKTQPSLKFPNAGSIFKNPEHESAGRLLDLCGLKGATQGGARVYENHANFIINYNSATSEDILKLMFKMQDCVYNKFNIKLEPEVIFMGSKTETEEELWGKISR